MTSAYVPGTSTPGTTLALHRARPAIWGSPGHRWHQSPGAALAPKHTGKLPPERGPHPQLLGGLPSLHTLSPGKVELQKSQAASSP